MEHNQKGYSLIYDAKSKNVNVLGTELPVCNALINKPKNFIRAKFILSPKNSFNVSDKTVTLFSTLIFIVGNGIGSTIPIY